MSRRICWNARRCLPRISGSHRSRLPGSVRIAPQLQPSHRILPLRRPRRSRRRFERWPRRHSPVPLSNFPKLTYVFAFVEAAFQRRAIPSSRIQRPPSSESSLHRAAILCPERSGARKFSCVSAVHAWVYGKLTWERASGKSANARLPSATHQYPGDSRRDG